MGFVLSSGGWCEVGVAQIDPYFMVARLCIDYESLLPYLNEIEKGRYLLVTRHRPSEGVELGPVGVGRCHIK